MLTAGGHESYQHFSSSLSCGSGTTRGDDEVRLAFHPNSRCLSSLGASLVAQLVKNPPTMRETWVRSLGWEDPLEKGKAPHNILAWRTPWTV